MRDPDSRTPEAKAPVNAVAVILALVALLVGIAIVLYGQRETAIKPAPGPTQAVSAPSST